MSGALGSAVMEHHQTIKKGKIMVRVQLMTSDPRHRKGFHRPRVLDCVAAALVFTGAALGQPISNLPYTISVPGSYYLDRNLVATMPNVDGITVASDDVTLDL